MGFLVDRSEFSVRSRSAVRSDRPVEMTLPQAIRDR